MIGYGNIQQRAKVDEVEESTLHQFSSRLDHISFCFLNNLFEFSLLLYPSIYKYNP